MIESPLPKPARGMLVDCVGGPKDGHRVRYAGQHRILFAVLPSITPASFHPEHALEPSSCVVHRVAYSLRQGVRDQHWYYVLDGTPDR